MIRALLFDLSRVILFPKDKSYEGELNALHKKLLSQGKYDFNDYFELDEELLSFLESIKNNCYLYIFTSGIIQDMPEVKSRIDEIFKSVFSSEKMGLDKKEVKSYKYIAKEMGLNPEEIMFIDDSELNIETAELCGMKVFLYSDYVTLRKELRGILKSR